MERQYTEKSGYTWRLGEERTVKKKIFFILLAVVLLMTLAVTASAESISYIDEFGDTYTAECILITSQDDYAFESDGWYAVTGDVTITKRIKNNAAAGQPAHLILADGASLTAPEGIRNPEGKELIIYGQQASSGQLFIEGIIENAAGIGGNDFEAGGILTINGGTIEAHGKHLAAGIGGGNNRSGGTITINGGVVRAYSEIDANSVVGAGIGGGCYADSGIITITGGVVFAQSGRGSAGIGGGCYANGEKITITGGTVTATGGPTGAGIGGGSGSFDAQTTQGGYGGEIYILGGTVTATGTNGGAGIGGGQRGKGASGAINGGQVTAMGIIIQDTAPGPGIGAGAGSTDQGTLRIIASYIKAGTSSDDAKDTTIDDYYDKRNPYINIIPMPMQPIKLSFISQPYRIRYAAGESFDPSGAVMLVDYFNETTKRFTDLTAFVFDVPSPLLFGTEEVPVRYTENGFTVSTTLPIMVSSTKLNVSFNTVFGSFVDTQMVEFAEKATRPENPIKDGCTFEGWYTDGTYKTELDFNTPVTENIVAVAKWSGSPAPAGLSLYGIVITAPPQRTSYNPGENFDPTGMVVNALYAKPITGYSLSPLTNLQKTDIDVTVTYTENGVTKSALQPITVGGEPYKIIRGANQCIPMNAASATFASDADFGKFVRVEVDGQVLPSQYYTAESGSTVITFLKKYIPTLIEGRHTLRIVSADGSATTEFYVESVPRTGDNSRIGLWLALLACAGTVLMLSVRTKKRNEE